MIAPSAPATSRRHNSATVRRAREMYGDGDSWTPTQIARYLVAQGTVVHVATVREWVIPGLAERRQKRQNLARQRKARGITARPRTLSPLLDRMISLRAAGLSYGGIVIVIRLDWRVVLTEDQVRYAIRMRREPTPRGGA